MELVACQTGSHARIQSARSSVQRFTVSMVMGWRLEGSVILTLTCSRSCENAGVRSYVSASVGGEGGWGGDSGVSLAAREEMPSSWEAGMRQSKDLHATCHPHITLVELQLLLEIETWKLVCLAVRRS